MSVAARLVLNLPVVRPSSLPPAAQHSEQSASVIQRRVRISEVESATPYKCYVQILLLLPSSPPTTIIITTTVTDLSSSALFEALVLAVVVFVRLTFPLALYLSVFALQIVLTLCFDAIS